MHKICVNNQVQSQNDYSLVWLFFPIISYNIIENYHMCNISPTSSII